MGAVTRFRPPERGGERLHIFAHGRHCGIIEPTGNGVIFIYDPGWKEAISLSLPIGRATVKASSNFFSHYVKDGHEPLFVRLSRLDTELPGALAICRQNEFPRASFLRQSTREINDYFSCRRAGFRRQLREIFAQRSALSGHDDKLACSIWQNNVYICEPDARNTHVLYPAWGGAIARFFALRLAEKLGLDVPATKLIHLDSSREVVLLAQRFDRFTGSAIHWETLGQACGNLRASLADAAETVFEHLPGDAQAQIFKAAVFARIAGFDLEPEKIGVAYPPVIYGQTLTPFWGMKAAARVPKIDLISLAADCWLDEAEIPAIVVPLLDGLEEKVVRHGRDARDMAPEFGAEVDMLVDSMLANIAAVNRDLREARAACLEDKKAPLMAAR